MLKRSGAGFIGGCIGALPLVVITYVMTSMGKIDAPPFVDMYISSFGPHPPGGGAIAVLLFIISGGVWGLLFGLFIKTPTILKAMLFGFLPTLWLLVAVNGYLGKPLFNGFTLSGILLPIIFNVIIWGFVLGWFMQGRIVKGSAVVHQQ